MSSEVTIDDLPDEMLEQIVQHLDWYDRQSLTLVSKRFARLTFGMGSNIELHISASGGYRIMEENRMYGRRPYSFKYRHKELYQALLVSQRPYKHVVVWISDMEELQTMLKIVDRFHKSIVTLKLISGHFEVDLSWVVQVLQTCPNLSSLDIKDLSLSSDHSIRMALEPMSKLRTLYARSRILNAITNCSEAFANVISLHTNLNPPKDLMQKLSSQLEELTLTFTVGDQITLPEENFPNLETLKFVWADRCADHLTRKHFQRLLKRTPKLKKLSIEPLSVQFNLLELVMENHKIIQHLEVPLDYIDGDDDDEDFEVYEGHPEERPNLKSLCLYDIEFYGLEMMAERFKFVNVRQLRLSQCDLVYFEWVKVLPDVFPSLTELDLEDEDPEEPINFVKIAKMISEYVPSLRRLTLDLRGRNLNLTTFMQFCGSLKVRELSVESDHLEIEGKLKAPLKKALSIRSLAIKTYTIDSNAYVPMMEAMPELRKLELQLSGGCSNETQIEMIRAKFPRCDIVRKRFKDTC